MVYDDEELPPRCLVRERERERANEKERKTERGWKKRKREKQWSEKGARTRMRVYVRAARMGKWMAG